MLAPIGRYCTVAAIATAIFASKCFPAQNACSKGLPRSILRSPTGAPDLLRRKKPVLNPAERECPSCNGTGVEPAKQPTRPGVRIFPPRCEKCLGRGRVAN
jgi:hypothetical protein